MDLTLGLLLSTVLGALSATENNCTAQELERCLHALNSIAQTEDLALAATKEELSIVCRRLQFGFRCIDDHSNRCFTAVQRRIFHSVVSESRHVIHDLCVPGELQDGCQFLCYLQYAPCWKNVSTDESKCALQYRRLAHNSDYKKNVNDNLKIHCCLFTEFVQCHREYVQLECGSEAEHFFQQHMDRMSGSLIHEHCSLFTHELDACVESRGTASDLNVYNFLSILIICLVWVQNIVKELIKYI